MTEFSLTLNDDQLQIQSWVHEFAADVIRPAAHEWDEREEFPWPVVQEAAKNGLYGVDFADPALPRARRRSADVLAQIARSNAVTDAVRAAAGD